MSNTKKRQLDAASQSNKPKRAKLDESHKKAERATEKSDQPSTLLVQEDVDFPRGGGTNLTPMEVKTIRAEAAKEADEVLFKEAATRKSLKGRKSTIKSKAKGGEATKPDTIRVEHLNYKRITTGMKILGQIVAVQPLALIVSLPNQLMGHIPITQISSQLTSALEAMDEGDETESDAMESDSRASPSRPHKPRIPELFDIFHVGQFVRCVVTAIHTPGTTDNTGLGLKGRGDLEKASRRVELSVAPHLVNAGVVKADLKPGFTLSAAIKSVEDHGYVLDLGMGDGISAFLSFEAAKQAPWNTEAGLCVGQVVDVNIVSLAKSGRTCTVSVDPEVFTSVSLSEVSNVSSILPGAMVQCLITAVVPSGLNLQVLGYFEGTVDLFHLPYGTPGDTYKNGSKIKARILYDLSATSPRRFALSLAEHILTLSMKGRAAAVDGSSKPLSLLQDDFPVGTTLEAAKVIRVEPERGLVLEVSDDTNGYVHISQVSDDHVAALSSSSGPWRVSTIHRARVTGYHALDGLLQLSLRPSVLEKRFIQVRDAEVGEVIKGTVKKLTDSALFVEISGNVDGVVWPNHYADITLKHPQKRFKPGGSIKCRVLAVNPERNRISLTAKKTLVESPLPIVKQVEDAIVGLVTHAVIFRVSDKGLQVEFFNNLKAFVPRKEASDIMGVDLSATIPVGKPVKVRILSVDPATGRITASIRQAVDAQSASPVADVNVGDVVSGSVAELHKDNVLLSLKPSQAKGLLSLNNLANYRGISASQLRASLVTGEMLNNLVVVSRNANKGIVIVATKPVVRAPMTQGSALSMDTVEVGSVVGGRVLRHTRKGALIKLNARITGLLHPTDCTDNFEEGNAFPAVDSILKAVVVEVDKSRNQLVLSMRRSRMDPTSNNTVEDPEVLAIADLQAGQTIRGFIKSVSEHGLYVMLGRNIDARVQIRELFDEYVKDWKSRFSPNQIVKGRILSVDQDKKQVEMSFRSVSSSSGSKTKLLLSDLTEGQKIEGKVKKVEDYGIFIELEGSKLSGLCHKTQISDNPDADVNLALRSFREGDKVKAMVLSVDHEKRRISLGLKPSYFTEADFESGDESGSETSSHIGILSEGHIDEEAVSPEEDMNDVASSHFNNDAENDSDADHTMQVDVEALTTGANDARQDYSTEQSTSAPKDLILKLEGGFQWSAKDSATHDEESGSESSADEDNDESATQRKRKRRKQIEQDLTADLHNKMPESTADFERVLLSSPDSSYLWIQYMSFLLQMSEVDRAREIGRRALRTINFREEQEKLNVWIALLNLENVYGTDESLESVFKEAARSNDSKTIHLRLASIFDQSGKHEMAEEQYKRTAKKFGHSSKVWTLYGEHYLKRGEHEQARKLLPRSLQSLEKRKHLKTISKFAQLEYKYGDAERGRTIFEGIVDSHSKRWDIWAIYMDMEAGQSNIQGLRNLFDRVLTQKMTSHKAKSFFKKWLELERSIGDEDGAEIVKAKAIEWTQRASGNPGVE